VCKSDSGGLSRLTRCRGVLKYAAQRVFPVHPVPGFSGCVSSSWRTGGTTGVWSSGVRLYLAAPALRCVTTAPLGDLDAFVAEIDFDAEPAAEGIDVAAQGVDLSVFDLTALRARTRA
jgi:hypothetical protein